MWEPKVSMFRNRKNNCVPSRRGEDVLSKEKENNEVICWSTFWYTSARRWASTVGPGDWETFGSKRIWRTFLVVVTGRAWMETRGRRNRPDRWSRARGISGDKISVLSRQPQTRAWGITNGRPEITRNSLSKEPQWLAAGGTRLCGIRSVL